MGVTCAGLDAEVQAMADGDAYSDLDTWNMLLDPAYRFAQTQEAALIGRIQAMSEQGMGIQAIAAALQVPLKTA
ncbi:hypothetical protein [Paenibacillus cookii]|nr:hypothetical protein [Paenibacillus cookii]